jgi:hypothetical protein
LLLNSEEYSVVDPDPKNPYVLKKNTVLWIQIRGAESGSTPKCHGSETLVLNKKTRPVLNYEALTATSSFAEPPPPLFYHILSGFKSGSRMFISAPEPASVLRIR